MPWYTECMDWASGKAAWVDDVVDAAHYETLTAQNNPARVRAAADLMKSVADLDEDTTPYGAVLGKSALDLDGFTTWAVSDGNACASFAVTPEGAPEVNVDTASDDPTAFAVCDALTRGDAKPAIAHEIAEAHGFDSAAAARSWLTAHLGAPRTNPDDGELTLGRRHG